MIKNFQEIISLAQEKEKIRLVVAVAQDESVLRGAELARRLNLIEPVLVGDEPKIKGLIRKHGLDLGSSRIIDVKDELQASYSSIELALAGEADAIMKGNLDSASFLRTVLDRKRGLRTDRLVTNISLLEDPKAERILYVTDAVVNVAPDLKEKLQIIENAVAFLKVMGIPKPRIAALSAVELITPSIPSTLDAACLSKMSERGQIKGAVVDGPFALDNVFSCESARAKGIKSPLVGETDLLLAPNIETANAIFKLLVHFANFKGIGVFVGTKVQTVQLPRESPPEAKLVGIATSILMLNEMGKSS
jgi:phosphate butyryltransferase